MYKTNNSFVTEDQISIADYSNSNNTLSCTEELCYPDPSDPKSAYTSYGVNKGQGFAWFALDSYEVLWRCVVRDEAKNALYNVVKTNDTDNAVAPSDLAAQLVPENQITELMKGGYSVWSNLYGDLWTAKYYILGIGFGVSLVRYLLICAPWPFIYLTTSHHQSINHRSLDSHTHSCFESLECSLLWSGHLSLCLVPSSSLLGGTLENLPSNGSKRTHLPIQKMKSNMPPMALMFCMLLEVYWCCCFCS